MIVEKKIHFGLCCIGKAPLLIVCDITKMPNDTFEILINLEVIAIDLHEKKSIVIFRKKNTN